MALKAQSLFLYGFQITPENQNITFGSNSGQVGSLALQAVIPLGYYSLSSLLVAVSTALQAQDPTNTYTVTADRTISGGTQNRVTIATSGSYLSIYFSSGSALNPATLLGFGVSDLTGNTSYTGGATTGSTVIPRTAFPNVNTGYSFLDTNSVFSNFGISNISASGVKQSVTWGLQQFLQVQYKYVTYSDLANSWQPLLVWMIQQKEFEYTPQITFPSTFYTVTLEDALDMEVTEMLPELPGLYEIPAMKFRVKVIQ